MNPRLRAFPVLENLLDQAIQPEHPRVYTFAAGLRNGWELPPTMRAEVVGVAQGLVPGLREQQGFEDLNVLTDAGAGEGGLMQHTS